MAQTVYGTDSANAAGRDGATAALPTDTISGDAVSSANLDKMDSDNNVSHEKSAIGDYSWIQIMLDIQETEGDICSLALHVDGFMDDDVNDMGGGGGVQIHCWNDEASQWDAIGSQSTSHTETDYDVSITSNIPNYINASGEIYLRVSAYHFEWDSKVSVDNLDLTVSTGYDLTAAVGSFALTGQAVALDRIRAIPIGVGSFTLGGQAVGLEATRKLSVAAATFGVTGQAVDLEAARELSAAVATFTLTGQTAGIGRTYQLAMGVGGFSLTGQAVNFVTGPVLSAGVGSFTLSGQTVTFPVTYMLEADAVAFILSGQDAVFVRITKLDAGAGDFVLTGQDVVFSVPGVLAAEVGAFVLGGQDVDFLAEYQLQAAVGAFVLGGQSVEFGQRWYAVGRGRHNVLFGAEATGRGLHRCANDALKLFELYMGTDGEPDLTAAPDKTSASLPFDSDALAASHEYRFVTRYRNAWNLVAQNIVASSIRLDANGDEELAPPSAPEEIRIDAAAGGAVRVRAVYRYLEDDEDVRADRFAVWLTSDGSTPNGYAGPTHTVTPTMVDGLAKLDWTSGVYADGLTIKGLVRMQRLL